MLNKFRLPISIAKKTETLKEPLNFKKIIDSLRSIRLTRKNIFSLVITLFLTVMGVVSLFLAQKRVNLRSNAQAGDVNFYFTPESATLQSQTDFVLSVNVNQNKLAFLKFEVNFDPTKLKLVGEPVLIPSTTFGKVIETTNMTDANTTGSMKYVLGLSPQNINTPPSGIIPLLRFTLIANTSNSNVSSVVTINKSYVEVNDLTSSKLAFTTQSSQITINPSTPTPTATTVATNNPPTLIPSNTPPNVTITSPADLSTLKEKGNFNITATASDSSGISKIEIYFNNILIRTCNDQQSCTEGYKLNDLPSGSYTITANATNRNGLSSTKSITVTKP